MLDFYLAKDQDIIKIDDIKIIKIFSKSIVDIVLKRDRIVAQF